MVSTTVAGSVVASIKALGADIPVGVATPGSGVQAQTARGIRTCASRFDRSFRVGTARARVESMAEQ
jgi:hypothetical protein